MADSTATDTNNLSKNFKFLRENNPNDFSLYHVQGMTCSSPNSLAANEANDQVGFPAAGILVLLSPRTGEQKYIQTPSLTQNIACVTFSNDGRMIAFIENGLRPYLSIWFVREAKPVNYFQVGNSGKLAFHPRKPFIVLIGSLLKDISVYNYIQGAKVAYSRWTTTPLSMCVPHDGKSVIVSGHRKITYFSLQNVDSMARSINTSIIESKRSFALGHLSEHTFIDIICGKRKHRKGLYAVTASGYVCKLKMDIIEKYEKIDSSLTCVTYGLDLLFVGCPDSVVKMCSPDNLAVVASLSLAESIGPGMRPKIKPLANVETSGIVVSDRYKIITSVFSDSSIYSWQVLHTEEGIKCSFILPSDYKHCYEDGKKEDNDSLCNHLHRASLIRQFVSVTSPNLLSKRDASHGYWAPPQIHGDPKVLGCNVNAVRISPDGKEIISGDENGAIIVQDATTGSTRRVIEAHMSQVTYVETMYDEDYKLICTGGRDRVIFILDAAHDFSLVQVLCDHSAAITAISLVRCSGTLTLVSAAADSVILIRTAVASSKPQFQITGQVPCSLGKHTFTCSSQCLATGSRNGVIHLFKTDLIRVNEPELIIQDIKSGTMGDGLETLDIDPSSSFLAVGCLSGHTTLYHLQTGNVVTTLNNQRGLANIKFTRDMQYMICQSFHRVGCVLVWKLPVRMTEYMRAKVDRKGETAYSKAKYDSFVKFLTDSESSFCRSGTSTPSIRSMNLLNRTCSSLNSCCQDSEFDYEFQNREAYPSSSDCSCCCTHSRIGCNYTTSDASVRMNSMPNISIISSKESSPTRVVSRRERTRNRSKHAIQRSNTCDNIKRSNVPANRKLSRYNSDLSYVSNNPSQNDLSSLSNHKPRPYISNSQTRNCGDDSSQTLSYSYKNIHRVPTPSNENNLATNEMDYLLDETVESNSPRISRATYNKSPVKERYCEQGDTEDGTFVNEDDMKYDRSSTPCRDSLCDTIKGGESSMYSEKGYQDHDRSTARLISPKDHEINGNCYMKSESRGVTSGIYTYGKNSNSAHTGGDVNNSPDETSPKRGISENTYEEMNSDIFKNSSECVNKIVDFNRDACGEQECHDSRTEDIIKAMQHLLAVRRSEDALRHQDKPQSDAAGSGVKPHKTEPETKRKSSSESVGKETSSETNTLTPANVNSISGMSGMSGMYQDMMMTRPTARESNKERLNNMGYEVITATDCANPKHNSSNSNLMNLPDNMSSLPRNDRVTGSVKLNDETHAETCSSAESFTTCSAFTSAIDDKPMNSQALSAYISTNNSRSSSKDGDLQQSQVSSFFKQDDYLQRLRDIRANFEKNIEALKRERQLSEMSPHG